MYGKADNGNVNGLPSLAIFVSSEYKYMINNQEYSQEPHCTSPTQSNTLTVRATTQWNTLWVVRTLEHRATSIVLDPQVLMHEYNEIHQALRQCGYPDWVLQNGPNTHSTVSKGKKDQSTGKSAKPSNVPVVIPYVKDLIDQLRQIYKPFSLLKIYFYLFLFFLVKT